MLNLTANALKVFLALDPCDMRKSFNGLQQLAADQLGSADPLHNKELTLRTIIEKGGDYLIGTKGNTSNRFDAVEKALERIPFLT